MFTYTCVLLHHIKNGSLWGRQSISSMRRFFFFFFTKYSPSSQKTPTTFSAFRSSCCAAFKHIAWTTRWAIDERSLKIKLSIAWVGIVRALYALYSDSWSFVVEFIQASTFWLGASEGIWRWHRVVVTDVSKPAQNLIKAFLFDAASFH